MNIHHTYPGLQDPVHITTHNPILNVPAKHTIQLTLLVPPPSPKSATTHVIKIGRVIGIYSFIQRCTLGPPRHKPSCGHHASITSNTRMPCVACTHGTPFLQLHTTTTTQITKPFHTALTLHTFHTTILHTTPSVFQHHSSHQGPILDVYAAMTIRIIGHCQMHVYMGNG